MIKSVKILPGCIACHTCQSICPKIFQVHGTSQVVSRDFQAHEKTILQAEQMCPVHVIAVEKTEDSITDLFETAILKGKKQLTHDVVEFIFSSKNFVFFPGQFVSFQMQDKQGNFARSYSLVDAGEDFFKLCIKIVPNGRGGTFLQSLKEGQSVKISPATGHFVLQKTQAPKVFIATGTGLAPIMAMLKRTSPTTEKIVLFGLRSEEDIFYKKELESFPNTKVIITLSSPSTEWKGKTGRVTDFFDLIPREAEVYICGNPAMVQSSIEALQAKKHLSRLVFHEEFKDQSGTKTLTQIQNSQEINPIVWIQNILILCGFLVPVIWYFSPDYRWNLWDLSWYAVTILMLIRPLGDIFPKWMIFRRLLPLRQGLGILSSAVVVTNMAFSYIPSPQSFMDAYFSLQGWVSSSAIIAHLAEISGFFLLITSNHLSQRTLGAWWKRIQRSSYIYFFAGGLLHSVHAVSYPSMAIVAVLWAMAEWKRRYQ